MSLVVFEGIFLPILGTTLGSACVFFMGGNLCRSMQKALGGFASGVMVAASIWSLIIPAVEESASLGFLSFLPAVAGFWLGVLFLLILNKFIADLPENANSDNGFTKDSMLPLAVTLHNLPEGMAVGVVIASYINGSFAITDAAVITLAMGIAIQNFPEGSIISMPIAAKGEKKFKSFMYGFLSGVVEPIGAILTILLARVVRPILPYMLSFAAGAMVFVVVEELIPEMKSEAKSSLGTIMFMAGFSLMMALDIALG